ncbi:MAG: phage portal protein [Chloroflexi bacterium]|nr:phage portal protein [Chloroflexota bacterium]
MVDEVKAYILDLEGVAREFRSYNLPEERKHLVGNQGLVNPPVDLVTLARFYDESTYHRNAVSVKARDVIGHDWTIEPEIEGDEDESDENAQKKELKTFFQEGAVEGFTTFQTERTDREPGQPPTPDGPGPGEQIPLATTFNSVMERLLIDYDTIGNAYMAVVREDRLNGKPQWYAHVHGSKMKVHRDRLRYRWGSGREFHWFKRFGLQADVHVKTGKIFPLGSLEGVDRASELIHIQTYTPSDVYYGLPEVTPAIGAMVLELLSRDFNISFFDNNAVPQYAVVVEGFQGDLPDDVRNAIKSFFTTSKGSPHQTLVLNLPAQDKEMQPSKITFQKLAAEIRDGSFHVLRGDARDETLVAHAVPPYRLGMAITGSLGATNIREANEIYKFQEVDTRRLMLEEKLMLVTRQGFKITAWALRFGEFDTSDQGREVDRWTKLVDGGLSTPNEGRAGTGQEKIEDRPELDEFYYKGRPWGDIVGGDTQDLMEERMKMVEDAVRTEPEPLAVPVTDDEQEPDERTGPDAG